MIGFLKRLWRDRRGNALVIAGAALPLVVGSAGLATDTIQWAMWKRQLQRAADSAAIAGVYAIVQDEGSRNNVLSAVDTDLAHNNHVGIATNRTAGLPTSGTYASDPYAVKVTLTAQKTLAFSSMFMNSAPVITTEATATVVPGGEYCVVSLEDTATTGITATGNASIDLGCGMITNSISMTAAVATGSSVVDASPIAAVGGISASSNWSGATLIPFTAAQEDPFANVYPPSIPNSCQNVTVNPSTSTGGGNGNGNGNGGGNSGTTTLNPGCYQNMTLNGTVVLNPGTYILDAGSLSIGAQANVSCSGCVFVLTSKTAATNPSSIGNVTINGGATVNLTAPAEGQPFAGILFYQDRRAATGTSANVQNLINGNSNSSYTGSFYFPNQQMTFTGTSGMTTNCVQMVARRVNFAGTTDIENVCDANSGASAFEGRIVRLVA